jgi:hypothetical protein
VVTTGSFSEFVFASNSETLPVELAQFDAHLSGDDTVRLRWTTVSEQNNSGFRIQRARADANGSSGAWAEVGSVDGAGTTTTPQSYQFTDDLPHTADRLTYRLKQVDTDGTTSISDPVTVQRRAVEQVQLLGTYPNPAHQQATVRFALPEGIDASDVRLRLFDVLGRQVRAMRPSTDAGRHEMQLDVSTLPSGLYVLRLTAGSAVKTQRVTVVR